MIDDAVSDRGTFSADIPLVEIIETLGVYATAVVNIDHAATEDALDDGHVGICGDIEQCAGLNEDSTRIDCAIREQNKIV